MKRSLLWLLLLAGCAPTARQVRSVTYPPGFLYVSSAEIRGPMGKMAVAMGELQKLLHQEEAPGDEAGRRRVLELLQAIDTEAAKLDGAALGNHPELDPMPAFRNDLALARRGAEADPPNYFAAGLAAQSCLRCHTGR